MTRIGVDFNFNHGLTGISVRGKADTPGLPERAPLSPSETPPADQMAKMTMDPRLGDPLKKALAPELSDPDMLRPERFQAIARQTAANARAASASLDPGPARQAVRKMAQVLENMQSDSQLLSILRGALYRG